MMIFLDLFGLEHGCPRTLPRTQNTCAWAPLLLYILGKGPQVRIQRPKPQDAAPKARESPEPNTHSTHSRGDGASWCQTLALRKRRDPTPGRSLAQACALGMLMHE